MIKLENNSELLYPRKNRPLNERQKLWGRVLISNKTRNFPTYMVPGISPVGDIPPELGLSENPLGLASFMNPL